MRLIDAEALKIKTQKIKAEALEHGFAPESVCGDILLNFLDNAPTIEAKPVVHAHWEGSRCSNCKRNLFELFDAGSHLIENFEEEVVACPFCGAQMDEKENENED